VSVTAAAAAATPAAGGAVSCVAGSLGKGGLSLYEACLMGGRLGRGGGWGQLVEHPGLSYSSCWLYLLCVAVRMGGYVVGMLALACLGYSLVITSLPLAVVDSCVWLGAACAL
jgi:hypothetical protein